MSGGTDKLINVWDYEKSELCGTLIGHSENICKLITFPVEKKTNPFVFGSSSWDGTARCWTEELSPVGSLILKTTDSSTIWSLTALGRDTFATAHADRSIRIWRGDRQVKVINSAHDDVVRDLFAFEGNSLLSVGNDGSVKIWDVSNGTEIQNIQSAHPSFIYGSTWNGIDRIATFGEEGIVKIWKWTKESRQLIEEETLRVPMISSWCGVFLDEATLIIAGSTGKFFVFSSNEPQKQICDIFESELNEFDQISRASKSSEIEKNTHDETILKYPGEKIGKIVLVRRSDDDQIEAHQWDGMTWQNLGQVLDPLSVKSPDFTFKVELDDTGKSYDLSYSWGENPYSVAKNFLDRNDLPIGYLDQVANFIVKNSGNPPAPVPVPSQNPPYNPIKPELYKIEAFNFDGVKGKLKAFGYNSDKIDEEEICNLLSKWPTQKLFPCLDYLRYFVLKSGTTDCLKFVPFDSIIEESSNNPSKDSIAGVTMILRLLCNASAVSSDPIDPFLIIKVIGKCTNSPCFPDNSVTWISLLIGLLYNSSTKGIIEITKQMVLLHGLLTRTTIPISEDNCIKIWWLIKGIEKEPMSMSSSIKKELERFPELKESLKLIN